MCSSIYLWRFFILPPGFKATRHLAMIQDYLSDLIVQGRLLLPLVLALSTLYYVVIEGPCMDPKRPQTSRGKLKAAPDAGTA